jgi:Flp pilus assembly protein TadG
MPRRSRLSLLRSDSGASALEFAIVMPIFVVLLFGIIAYAIYFGAVHGAAQLAADAARASVAGLSDAERADIARQHVIKNVPAYSLFDPSKLEVTAEPLGEDARQFRVSVRYDASALPIWNFAPLFPLPDKTIVRAATIQRGGY